LHLLTLFQPKPSAGGPGTGLAVNVDVANGTFWIAQDLHQAARNLCNQRNRQLDYRVFERLMKPIRDRNGGIGKSEDFQNLTKLCKLKFRVKHRGKADCEFSLIDREFN
jgi:eukaryotic translation initiation factor 2C